MHIQPNAGKQKFFTTIRAIKLWRYTHENLYNIYLRLSEKIITLDIVGSDYPSRHVNFSVPAVTVGRGTANTCVIEVFHLSSNHGQFIWDKNKLFYQDLRSTNGSQLVVGQTKTPISAEMNYKIKLEQGSVLELGDPQNPIVMTVTYKTATSTIDLQKEKLIATKPASEVQEITLKAFQKPKLALKIHEALTPLSRRHSVEDTYKTILTSCFSLLPKASHASLLVRPDSESERFKLAFASFKDKDGSVTPSNQDGVRASLTVLKKILSDKSGVITANAQKEMGASQSILAGKIQSMVAVPLMRDKDIVGILQIDNRSSTGIFDMQDLDLALILSDQATLALDNAQLVARLRLAEKNLKEENKYLKKKQAPKTFKRFIGESSAVANLMKQISKVVKTDATVCITGETGTGKELIASSIHANSKRSNQLFVAQNCAALPSDLLESELFGHKKGAFTSAHADKKGLFSIADKGTLFLDEIGEMPPALQSKLLRTLQEGTIRPVGDTEEKRVDVRIVCATHRDLAADVKSGRFREDLFYRLMVFPIRIPPLRERHGDIRLLAQYFYKKYCEEYRRDISGLSDQAFQALDTYEWPGNVRELENEIQRLVIQADDDAWIELPELSPRILGTTAVAASTSASKGTLKEMMETIERSILIDALRQHGGNKTQTAKTLGITREGLHKKLSRHGI